MILIVFYFDVTTSISIISWQGLSSKITILCFNVDTSFLLTGFNLRNQKYSFASIVFLTIQETN